MSRTLFLNLNGELCITDKKKLAVFTKIYLTKREEHDIIIKLSHESGSRVKMRNKGKRENGSGDRQWGAEFVQGKFT